MGDTSTTSTRPASYDDLADYQREGHRVATVATDMLAKYPTIGQHLLAAIVEAKALGLDVRDDGQITVPLTTEELDAKLEQAQRSWDATARWYDEASSGMALPSWQRSSVDRWAEAEGRDPIDWDAIHDALAAQAVNA